MDEGAIILGYIISGIICGFICMGIASSRKMKGGFGWGFWLLIIGIIVVAVRPKDDSNSIQPKKKARVFYCNSCKRVFSGTSMSRCPECRVPVFETKILRKDWRNFTNEKKSQLKKAFSEGQYLEGGFVSSSNKTRTNELRDLKELLDDGTITQEEFNAKKREILRKM